MVGTILRGTSDPNVTHVSHVVHVDLKGYSSAIPSPLMKRTALSTQKTLFKQLLKFRFVEEDNGSEDSAAKSKQLQRDASTEEEDEEYYEEDGSTSGGNIDFDLDRNIAKMIEEEVSGGRSGHTRRNRLATSESTGSLVSHQGD